MGPCESSLLIHCRLRPSSLWCDAVRDAEARAAAEVALVKQRVAELEAEAQQLRASSGVMSMFTMPSKEDVLSGVCACLCCRNCACRGSTCAMQVRQPTCPSQVETGPCGAF